MRSIHRGISGIGIDRIERDLVLFDVRIGQSIFIVKVTADFFARGQPFLEQMFVPQIRFIFFQLIFFNEGAKVLEFLRPLVSQLHHQKGHSAKNGDRHVDSVLGQVTHLQRRPRQHDRDRWRDQDGGVHGADRNVQQTVRPIPRPGIESQKNVGGK